jgi:hypothetical protein
MWSDGTLLNSEILYETEEAITVEENQGYPTIEITRNGSIVWDNVNGFTSDKDKVNNECLE